LGSWHVTPSPDFTAANKSSGQAVVTLTIDGRPKDRYLRPYGSPPSKTRYASSIDRHAKGLAPCEAKHETAPSVRTVAELMLRYVDYAKDYYVWPEGTNTSQLAVVKAAIRTLCESAGGGDSGRREFRFVDDPVPLIGDNWNSGGR
jgi:hypothetical protein